MMLAQSLTDVAPEWLRNMMLFLAALAATVYYVKEIFGGKKKREVTFGFESASKNDFEAQKAHCTKRHAELFTAIEQTEEIINAAVEKKMEKIDAKLDIKHKENTDRLNGVENAVSGLRVSVDTNNQQTAGLGNKLDRLFERMPRRP